MRTVIINREEEKTIPASLENLLPFRLTDAVRRAAEQPEVGIVEEIRLRRGRCASLTSGGRNIILDVVLGGDEMEGVMNRLCGGSLYAYSDTICRGYITLAGGVRAGICGRAAIDNGRIIGVSEVSSIVLRLPHRTPGVGGELCRLLVSLGLSRRVLVYSPPGVGKTTVLRAPRLSLRRALVPCVSPLWTRAGALCGGWTWPC